VGGLPIVIVHQPSSDTTTAFDARAKGKVLTFQAANDDASSVIDLDTALDVECVWAVSRRAAEGHATEARDSRTAVLVCLVAVPPGDQGLHRALKGETVMQDRRTFLGLAAASLLPIDLDAQTSAAQASAPRPPPNWRDTR
jgi:hypothetical protein